MCMWTPSIGLCTCPRSSPRQFRRLSHYTYYTYIQQTVKDGVRLDAKKMKDAIERVQVLEAYLDEVRRGVTLIDGPGVWID